MTKPQRQGKVHPERVSLRDRIMPSSLGFRAPLSKPPGGRPRRVWGGTAILLALSAGALTAQPAPGVPDPSAAITAETIRDRLYVLASDGFRGRDTPSPGLDAAAAYLVSEHRRAGLLPAGEDGTFYQRYPFRLVRPERDRVRIRLEGTAGTAEAEMGRSAFVRGGTVGELDADIVFLGIAAGWPPEPGSLEGRIALVSTPGEWGGSVFQLSNRQALFARQSGALAVIHVLEPNVPERAFGQLADQFTAATWRMGEDNPFPQIFLSAEVASQAISNLQPWLARGPDEDPVQRPLGARFRGTIPLEVVQSSTPANVVAVLPGSDPVLREEFVILSAHYDHVGVGLTVNGDSIYNGADDNGSGTAALLEVARALASGSQSPRRSIVFLHVSGEEKGLLGSQWFVDHPTFDLSRAVANLNADMIGGNAHADSVIVIGKTYSTLGPLVDRINGEMPELNLTTSDDLWPEQRFFFRSDQYHFMRKEIPALFFFTGLHECYHQPCDEVDFVDHDKAARVARLLLHTVLALANQDERPTWDPAGLEEVRSLTGGGGR
jgi:hypothetical protein